MSHVVLFSHFLFALLFLGLSWFCFFEFRTESNRYSKRKSTLGNFTIERPKE